MSSKSKKRPASGAMRHEDVLRIQALRRSNAAQPHAKRPTRAAQKRTAFSGW